MWSSKNTLKPVLQVINQRWRLFSIRNYSNAGEDPEAEWDRMYQRGVPRTMEEMSSLMGKTIDSPPNSKLLKVAIVGVPNCGKSTLINQLMGWRVCSVSSKVHTTRINARGVFNQGSTQLVFLDTPGLVTPSDITKHRMERSVLLEAEKSLHNADLMAVVHDMSNRYNYSELHERVLRLLALYPHIPSILVLNKLDIFKSKRRLLDATRILTDETVGGKKVHHEVEKSERLDKEKLIRKALQEEEESMTNASQFDNDTDRTSEIPCRFTEEEVSQFIKGRKGWANFQDVFMISALKDLGVDDLRNYLVSKAYASPWIFSSSVVTDQNPQEIALMTVREKFLETFKNEIPYKIKFTIDHWELLESELLNIVIRAGIRRSGLARFVIGGGGARISNISQDAEQELCNTFRSEVKLRINVVHDPSIDKTVYKS